MMVGIFLLILILVGLVSDPKPLFLYALADLVLVLLSLSEYCFLQMELPQTLTYQ